MSMVGGEGGGRGEVPTIHGEAKPRGTILVLMVRYVCVHRLTITCVCTSVAVARSSATTNTSSVHQLLETFFFFFFFVRSFLMVSSVRGDKRPRVHINE